MQAWVFGTSEDLKLSVDRLEFGSNLEDVIYLVSVSLSALRSCKQCLMLSLTWLHS